MKLFKYQFVVIMWLSLILVALLSVYTVLRQGYLNLFAFNQISADVAVILLGTVLLIGPLTRIYDLFDGWLKFRKAIGMTAFVYALIHTLLSYFVLFPKSRFVWSNIPFVLGLCSMILLGILFLYSYDLIIQTLNRKIWWRMQNIGVRWAGLLGILHFALLKYQEWILWLENGGGIELVRPYLPPVSLLLILFVAFVFLVRVSDVAGIKISRFIIPIIIVSLLIVIQVMIAIGYQNTPGARQLTWDVCQQIPGSHIQDSFPAVCVSPDGRHVTQIIYPVETISPEDSKITQEFYGSSTFAECAGNEDCKVSGCNTEICQGALEEELFSVCVVPDSPTPDQLGLSCGCVESRCQWQ